MRDRYRELLQRSFKDAAAVAADVEDEYGVPVTEQMLSQMAMSLYHYRVRRFDMKRQRAEEVMQMPEGSPDMGRY